MVLDTRIPMMSQQVNALQSFTAGRDARQRETANALALRGAQQQEREQLVNRLAKSVLSSNDKPQAYALALRQAERAGIPLDGVPQVYGESAEIMLNMYASPAEERTALLQEMEAAGIDPASGEGRALIQSRYGMRPPGPQEAPAGYRVNDDGTMSAILGGPADPAVRAAQRGPGMTVYDPQTGNPIMSTGRQPLGRAASNEQEKDLGAEVNLFDRLQTLGELAGLDESGRMTDPSMLTYRGQAENFFTAQAEKLGVSVDDVSRQALVKRTKFVTGVEQLFNAYRKEITGAAAAVQELERLKKSFINMDMAPTEFEAAYSQYSEELQRSMRVRRRLMREGFNISEQNGGAAMDRLFLSGGDDDPQARFGELSEQYGVEKAYELMAREGYAP
jgi:hypothetical protein